VTIKVKTVP